MAITFQSISTLHSATGFPSSPLDFSFDAGTGADRCVIVWVWTLASATNALTGCDYAGVPSTISGANQAWSGANDNFRVFVFTGAASGSNTVHITWTGTPSAVYAIAESWDGVGTASGITFGADISGDTQASLTIPTTSGDTAVAMHLVAPPGERFTPAGTETKRFDADGTGCSIVVLDKPAVGTSTTVAGNSDGTTVYESSYGVALSPTGGGDVTAPVLTSPTATGGSLSATGSVTSNEVGTLWFKMDTSSTATDPGAGNEASSGWTSQAMTVGSNSVNFGAQTAGTKYGHYLGIDASGNRSTVANSSSTTVTSGSDSTAPTMTGTLSISSITTTGYNVSWSVATDNVGVTGYQISLNSGSSWTTLGNVLTTNVTGRTPGTTDTVWVRAYDAAPNYSTPLTTTATLNSTSATTGILANGSAGPLANTLVYYSYYPNGRIGSLTGITPVEGTGTTNSSAMLVITGLAAGSGLIFVSYRATSGLSDNTTDLVYSDVITSA